MLLQPNTHSYFRLFENKENPNLIKLYYIYVDVKLIAYNNYKYNIILYIIVCK